MSRQCRFFAVARNDGWALPCAAVGTHVASDAAKARLLFVRSDRPLVPHSTAPKKIETPGQPCRAFLSRRNSFGS